MEPLRTKAYSTDIGWRIVWQRTAMGYTFKAIASRLQISVGTAHRIFRKFVTTGDVSPCRRSARPGSRKLDDHHEVFILALVFNNPTLYLREICQKITEVTSVTVSPETVCRVLQRNGYTRKKVLQVAKQRSVVYRSYFLANALQFSRELLVWTDEMGTDRRDQLRMFGYALKGERAVCHRTLTRGTRISAIAAMTSDGVLGYELTTGSVNVDRYFDFVRGCLVPCMQPFPGKHSILILDNCSVHHAHHIEAMLYSLGIPVLFLPPYSPDLNPIEELFSFVKRYLQCHDDIIQATNNPVPIIHSAFQSVTKYQCEGWITHSGYS